MLAQGADFLSVFDTSQRNALAMFFLRLHGQEIVAAETFWGLWLFPLGILVYRSRMLPRFLGVWLVLNGIAYVLASLVGLAMPQYEDALSAIAFPVQFGEVAFMLWLLIMGTRPKPPVPAPHAHGSV
jgi:hypothetical protein